MSRPLRVAIDARLFSGEYGGVEQVIVGLAHGLSSLRDGDERYEFLVFEGNADWLRPHISGPCSLRPVPAPAETITWKHRLVRIFPRIAASRRRLLGSKREPALVPPVPVSDGLVEREGFDVIHFTKQDGFRTLVPSIYHPHDLQHVHLPEFFTQEERARRDLWYRVLCDQAAMVTVTSDWGKRDLVDNFGIAPGKVKVIPLAPAVTALAAVEVGQLAAIRQQLCLPSKFLLYPAQTWPHKNHLGLVKAVALLKDSGTKVTVVCPGRKNEHFREIERAIDAAGITDSFVFLGFVSEEELSALFQLATGLVMPTFFEAAGGFGPVADAFASGVPVACSDVTSLPEQVGDAALVFDPRDVESMARAIECLWSDEALRTDLARRGRVRVSQFSWDRVARTFRAHYRRLAGLKLADDDVALVTESTEF